MNYIVSYDTIMKHIILTTTSILHCYNWHMFLCTSKYKLNILINMINYKHCTHMYAHKLLLCGMCCNGTYGIRRYQTRFVLSDLLLDDLWWKYHSRAFLWIGFGNGNSRMRQSTSIGKEKCQVSRISASEDFWVLKCI